MNRRRQRERKILNLVHHNSVRTQAEICEALAEEGIEATQATVSRDLSRLGVRKVALPGTEVSYQRITTAEETRPNLGNTLREFAVGFESGQALLAVLTRSGCANLVGVAIDEANLEGVVATVAGDDSLLVLCDTVEERDRLREHLRALVSAP